MKKTLKEIIEMANALEGEDKEALLSKQLMDDDDIQPLRINKEKILNELKAAQTQLKAQKIDENDRELLTIIQESGIMDKDKLSNIVNSGATDLEIANNKIKQLENASGRLLKDLELTKTSFQSERQQRLDVAKRNAIAGELTKLGVHPNSMDILSDHFSNKLNTLVGEDGSISVVDKNDEITNASEVFQSWSETEQSKQFIKAPLNVGAGTSSGTGGGSEKLTLEQISQIPDRAARLKAMTDNNL